MLIFIRFFVAQTIISIMQPGGIQVIEIDVEKHTQNDQVDQNDDVDDELEDLVEDDDDDMTKEEMEKAKERVDAFFMFMSLLFLTFLSQHAIPMCLMLSVV